MAYYLIAFMLISTDIFLKKLFGRGFFIAFLAPTYFYFLTTLSLPKNYGSKWLKILLLAISRVAFLKILTIDFFSKDTFKIYLNAFLHSYLILSFVFIWIYGWGYEKNFVNFGVKIMFGIEGDPNYSLSAILMATIVLYLTHRMKLRTLIIINTIFFILLFSRTAYFSMLIFLIMVLLNKIISQRKITFLLYSIIIIISLLPFTVLSLNDYYLEFFSNMTSGRVGYWYYLMTGEIKLGSEHTYLMLYAGKQAHNGLFQCIVIFGPIVGVSIFVIIHIMILNMCSSEYSVKAFLPLFSIEMFLNSFSATYFLIFMAGAIWTKNGISKNVEV